MTSIGVFAALFDEQKRILCVKRNYRDFRWTLPGGRLEPYEDPLTGVQREVYEETGYHITAGDLIGVYSFTQKDDIVLFFASTITGHDPAWELPTGELSAIAFFPPDALPEEFSPGARQRVMDAAAGKRGIVHVFEPGL
jgi:8-oxo-dGTP diphosphatase